MIPAKALPPTKADIERRNRAAVVIQQAMDIAEGDPQRALMAMAEAIVILKDSVSPGYMRLKRGKHE